MRRLAALAVFLIVSCSGGAVGAGDYQLGEFFISGPVTISEGTGAITVNNTGEFPHTLVVSTPDGSVMTATDLIMPGETVSLGLALEPGSYQFTCRIVGQGPDGQLVDHYERGMLAMVTVGG